jgi:phage shock protein PspC (stress-responsive transcriptional regulator)
MSTTPPDTQPPPTSGPDSGPRVGWDEIRDLASIRRTVGDRRRVAGVAGGVARHLDIDPLIVRVAFVVLTFFGGAGLVLYIACWLLVPEEGSDWGRVALDRRSRTVALVLVGALVVVILLGHTWWGSGYPWGLLIVAGIVALIATAFPRRDRGAAPAENLAAPGAVPSEGQTQAYAVPPTYVTQPRPVNPRRKGPILFWFALAVMAVAVGVLGVVDLAGASVAPSAYPALVLALSGAFLLLGAFWGRAGGIILVGLLAAGATVGATIGDQWDPHREVVRPVSSAAVQSSYHLDAGNLVVDLSHVTDPDALDGRTVHVSGGVGHLDITVPTGVNVVTHASISGPGGINAFGQDSGGVDTAVDTVHRAGPGAPTLTIDADLHIGAIDLATGGN